MYLSPLLALGYTPLALSRSSLVHSFSSPQSSLSLQLFVQLFSPRSGRLRSSLHPWPLVGFLSLHAISQRSHPVVPIWPLSYTVSLPYNFPLTSPNWPRPLCCRRPHAACLTPFESLLLHACSCLLLSRPTRPSSFPASVLTLNPSSFSHLHADHAVHGRLFLAAHAFPRLAAPLLRFAGWRFVALH